MAVAARRGNNGRPAIREKDRGIWQTFTWPNITARCAISRWACRPAFAGDKLAVIGDNGPRLYWARLAAQCLGGVAAPVYQDAIAAERVCIGAIAEDQEQVDQIMSIKPQLPRLGVMVYNDPAGLQSYAAPCLKSFQSTIAIGEVEVTPQPARNRSMPGPVSARRGVPHAVEGRWPVRAFTSLWSASRRGAARTGGRRPIQGIRRGLWPPIVTIPSDNAFNIDRRERGLAAD